MWVGEQSFVSPTRRRIGTIVAQHLSRLMVVPSGGFREVLAKLNLTDRFQVFRATHLEQGLCGRCGNVGDHFTHVCPMASRHARNLAKRSTGTIGRLRGYSQRLWSGTEGASTFMSEGEPLPLDAEGATRQDVLQAFLHGHRLLELLPLLHKHGVQTIDDLDTLNFEELDFAEVDSDTLHTQLEELKALKEERDEQIMHRQSEEELQSQHLAFLSHFKIEAGTEAALMRSELEQALKEDGQENLVKMFDSPIFLDSEDLRDLSDLQARVRQSHNLVLLLTANVLLRPWVLIELVTAMEYNVRVVPVEIKKPGKGFSFPDEEFYAKLRKGQILDTVCTTLLKEEGLSLADIERAVRMVFKKIAVPYSPHRPESIRKAEVRALLKQVRLRPPTNGPGARASLDGAAWRESSAMQNTTSASKRAAYAVKKSSSGVLTGDRKSDRRGIPEHDLW